METRSHFSTDPESQLSDPKEGPSQRSVQEMLNRE